MQEDITEAMEDFRKETQYIWNKLFGESNFMSTPEGWMCFGEIESALFGAIVLSRVGYMSYRSLYRTKPLEFITISYRDSEENDVLVGEKDRRSNNMVWQEFPLKPDLKTQIWFKEYFQWNFQEKWDFPFIRAYIAQHDGCLRGKEVLLEREKCVISFVHGKHIPASIDASKGN